MYVPNMYRVEDAKEIESFIATHSFATLICVDERNMPIATHVPLQLESRAGHHYLTGHLAKANPQWKHITNGTVLAIFQGPHAYISSSWYSQANVPTWNYTSVHMYGTAEIVDESRLKEMLASMLIKYETGRDGAVLWETLPDSLLDSQMKGIVGIEIQIQKIEAAYKMSQNRNETDYHSIIEHLQDSDEPLNRQVADIMEKLR